MERIPNAAQSREIDQGSFNIVTKGAGQEVGCVWVEPEVRTVVAPDGRTDTVLVEHWYLYPGYVPPRLNTPIAVQWVDPVVAMNQSFPTRQHVEAYVRGRVGDAAFPDVEYHRAEVYARRIGP